MVLDSGATSHFVSPEENLPITGKSNKIVALLNGSTITATHTAELSFDALTNKASNAHVLPELQHNSLVSVGKLADADYTMVFHPAQQGVMVHKRNTFQIRLLCTPVLQGWQDANGLW